MQLSETDAISWVEKIISVAVIFQSIEFLQLRNTVSERGVWRWSVLRREFEFLPAVIRKVLDFSLGYSGFVILLLVRIAAAVGLFLAPQPAFAIVLLLSTVLISLRWRGTFNGGSDFMTFTILLALCIATSLQHIPGAARACLWLIAMQVCTSYVVAGWVKLRRRNWRSGRALAGFLGSTIYEDSPFLRSLARRSTLMLLASWGVMLFECTFPLALLHSQLCLVFIGASVLFHLANFYVFGLNRFLFAWAAAYPALYFCS